MKILDQNMLFFRCLQKVLQGGVYNTDVSQTSMYISWMDLFSGTTENSEKSFIKIISINYRWQTLEKLPLSGPDLEGNFPMHFPFPL